MHGGASGVGGAAELGMEALEPARSANKSTVRENIVRSDVRVPNGRVPGCPSGWVDTAAADLVCNSRPGTVGWNVATSAG